MRTLSGESMEAGRWRLEFRELQSGELDADFKTSTSWT